MAQSVGMEYVGPFTFNFVRSILGGVFLIPCIWILGKINPAGRKVSDNRQSTGRRNLVKGGVLCGIFLFAASNFQQFGISYTTVGKAGFITACYIVIVPIISLFLRKMQSAHLGVGIFSSSRLVFTVYDGVLFPLDMGILLCLSAQSCFPYIYWLLTTILPWQME